MFKIKVLANSASKESCHLAAGSMLHSVSSPHRAVLTAVCFRGRAGWGGRGKERGEREGDEGGRERDQSR